MCTSESSIGVEDLRGARIVAQAIVTNTIKSKRRFMTVLQLGLVWGSSAWAAPCLDLESISGKFQPNVERQAKWLRPPDKLFRPGLSSETSSRTRDCFRCLPLHLGTGSVVRGWNAR